MRALLVCLGVCIPIFLWAQNNQVIRGNIIDDESGEPVPFANVGLYEAGEEEPVMGTFSDEQGAFALELENVDEGDYGLIVQFVGYENYEVNDLEIGNGSGNLNLGTIKIAKAATELEEIVVEGGEINKTVETNLEGMIIDPDHNISNIGGNVIDILRNTPSIAVDQDGGITIRGSSSTNVLINGRNSALSESLDGIPASAIESIEVINNPGARYDAQGTGGVINIKLKQGDEGTLGTSGRAEVTLGTRYRLNTSLNINHQGERFNVYGGYTYRRSPSIGNAESERTVFGDNPQRIVQNRDVERNDTDHTINYGFDYYLNKNKFSYEGIFETEDESDSEITYSSIFDLDDNITVNNVRDNRETEENYTFDNSLIYERLFNQKDREFRALISHSYRDNLETQNTITRPIDAGEEYEPLRQRADTDEKRQNIVIQADYVHPLAQGKFEVGYKTMLRDLDNDYTFEGFSNETGEWLINPDVSNRFRYHEQVHALYAIYQHSFDRFDLSLGTRVEQTIIDTKLYNTGEENEQRYFNPFPSIQGMYHLTDNHSLKFTYSRRIDRPGAWRLNPFPDIADTLNIRMGNPELQPEFIQSLEFGHKVDFASSDLTSTAFYRRTNGEVDFIISVDENGVATRTPQNLLSSTDYGLELIGTSILSSWWAVNGSVTLFRRMIDGSNLDQGYTNESFAWNTKLVSNMALPWKLNFQLTGNYESREVEAQGFDYARYYINANFQRKLLGDNGSVSLSLRDIFNTYEFGGENSTDEFESRFLYKRDTRRVYVSLEYRF